VDGFKKFLLRGNVVDLAVAVVIGTARLGSGASVARASSFEASSVEFSTASTYSTHSTSHSYACL
jgi:hypothetical protein